MKHIATDGGVMLPPHTSCWLVCDADGEAVPDRTGKPHARIDFPEAKHVARALGIYAPTFTRLTVREFRNEHDGVLD